MPRAIVAVPPRATFKISPTANRHDSSAEFPYEMKGSGTPVSGRTPSTAKKFTVAWIRITEVMPAASSFA